MSKDYLQGRHFIGKFIDVLRDIKTINEGHSADLKMQTKNYRVWLERSENLIYIEKLCDGKWVDVVWTSEKEVG